MKNRHLHWHFFETSEPSSDITAFLNNNVDLDIQTNSGVKHQIFYRQFKGKKYVIKKYTNLDKKGLGRKIELTLKSLFKPAAKKSFMGAKNLLANGIPTVKPVAWSKAGFFHRQISFFVYEYIDALGDAEIFIKSLSHNEDQKREIFRKVARSTRDLHDNGFKHHDIILNNFLVTRDKNTYHVFLIDTDSISSSHLNHFFKIVKLFFDLRCIRRFRPEDKYLTVFFDEYFNKEVKPVHINMWLFWVRGGFNLYRRQKLKKTLPTRFSNYSIDCLKFD